jgi:hypothetical protein
VGEVEVTMPAQKKPTGNVAKSRRTLRHLLGDSSCRLHVPTKRCMVGEKTPSALLRVCMFCNREVQPGQEEKVFNATGDGSPRVVHQTCYLNFRADPHRRR